MPSESGVAGSTLALPTCDSVSDACAGEGLSSGTEMKAPFGSTPPASAGSRNSASEKRTFLGSARESVSRNTSRAASARVRRYWLMKRFDVSAPLQPAGGTAAVSILVRGGELSGRVEH